MHEWTGIELREMGDDMQPFAQMLDAAYGGNNYATTLASLRTRIDHPESTPSAQVLAAAREHKGFFKYAMKQSQQHHESLLAQPLDAATLAKFEESVQASLAEQQRLESLPQGQFENYVASSASAARPCKPFPLRCH